MARVLSLRGDLNHATHLLRQMKEEMMVNSQVILDTRTYNVLLNGMSDRLRAARSKDDSNSALISKYLAPMENIYYDMSFKRNITPDGFTYSAMIKGCIGVSDGERASLYFENMLLQLRMELEEKEKKEQNDDTSIIKDCITAEDVRVCTNQLKSAIGTENTNNIIRKHQPTLDKISLTTKNVHRGRKAMKQNDFSFSAAEEAAKRSEILAVNFVESLARNSMTKSTILIDTFVTLCEEGRTELALELKNALDALVEDDPLGAASVVDLTVQNALLHGLCSADDMQRATSLFELMTENANRRITQYQPRPTKDAPSASEYYGTKKKKKQKHNNSSSKTMDRPHHDEIPASPASTKNNHAKRPLFSDQADAVTYTTMIHGLLYNNNKNNDTFDNRTNDVVVENCDKAVHLFQEMEKLGIPRDREAYHTLVRGLCLNGKPDHAFPIFEDMGDVDLRDTEGEYY